MNRHSLFLVLVSRSTSLVKTTEESMEQQQQQRDCLYPIPRNGETGVEGSKYEAVASPDIKDNGHKKPQPWIQRGSRSPTDDIPILDPISFYFEKVSSGVKTTLQLLICIM